MKIEKLNEINLQIDTLINSLKEFESGTSAIDSLLTAQARVNTIYQDENKRDIQPSAELLPIGHNQKNEVKKDS